MPGSVNKVILVGNLGRDPDVRTMQNGKKVCTLSLATTDSWKDKETGEKKDKTEWHRIVVFNDGLVGVLENYLKKGAKIYVEGSLQTRKWTDDSGTEKYTTEVVVQGFGGRIDFLDGKNSNNDFQDEPPEQPEKTETSEKKVDPKIDSEIGKNDSKEDLDDEIPF